MARLYLFYMRAQPNCTPRCSSIFVGIDLRFWERKLQDRLAGIHQHYLPFAEIQVR